VRDIIVKATLAVLLVALAPGLASAAGLGRLTVLSALGHPLNAEIELVSVSKAELGSLSARIAPPEAYQKANLQYNSALPGAKVSIEKRPDGRMYVKITTLRPVNEPFIDLMVDLTWSAGRILREYTALLDPPGVGAMPLREAAPTVSAAPEMRPAPTTPEAPAAPLAPAPQVAPVAPEPPASAPPSKPIAPAPAPAPTPAEVQAQAAGPAAGTKEYGPIKRGETLTKIAQSVKPEGVTLEQMLLALYRANEDAFIRKNINMVRTGTILRIPDIEQVETISNSEANTQIRTHVIVWREYRQRLAEAAGKGPEGGTEGGIARGQIVPKVEEPASGGPKEVVRISKGEPPSAGAGKGKAAASPAERIRALEEEVVARDKALTEANERIEQLEKTIKDMQKLMALRSEGMAAAQKEAQQAVPPAPAPVPAPEVSPAARPAPPQAPEKPQPMAKAEQPKPKPKVVKPAPSPQEPGLVDQVMQAVGDPMYLAAGGGVIVLGGLALWMARRRRSREALDMGMGRESPTLGPAAAAAAGVVASTDDTYPAATPGAAQAGAASDDVDPLAEAEVYIAYGRDGQAEEILKEALTRTPSRPDVKLKLLEIYAARKDKKAFGELASDVQRQIGSSGDDWLKVAAMGYAFDPDNPLYMAGKGAEVAPAPSGPRTGQNIDFDLGIGTGAGLTTTDIELGSEAAAAVQAAAQTVVDTGTPTDLERARRAADAPSMPDFTLDVPSVEEPAEAGIGRAAAVGETSRDPGTIDFQIELPPAGTPIHELPTVSEATSPGGTDFKLDIPGGLDLGTRSAPTMAQGIPTTKDGHWYDVQTKFDLAKAYQEMGDKAGAKEILQEVINEGDAEQKSQAKALLDSLG